MYFLSRAIVRPLASASPLFLFRSVHWAPGLGPTEKRTCDFTLRVRRIALLAQERYDVVILRCSVFDWRRAIRGDYERPANWPAGWVRELNWRLNNFPFLTGDIHQLSKLECNALEIICAVCNVIIRCCFIISLRPTILKRYLDYWVSLALRCTVISLTNCAFLSL